MLRVAKISDADTIRRLREESIRGLAYTHYKTDEVESWCGVRTAEDYHSPIQDKVVLVEEHQGQIFAFGQLDSAKSVIEAIYVHPSKSRQGLGLGILQALEAIAAAEGIRVLMLEASLNAVQFYERAGYCPATEEGHEFVRNHFASSILMRRQLAPPYGTTTSSPVDPRP
jgi:putative acetyltransferase